MSEKRHHKLGMTDKDVLQMYETMLAARMIDERMWLLNRAGKIAFVISCQGQEAAQVGAAMALDNEQDYVLPYYRDMGVVLHFGMSIKDLMLSGFAKEEDPNSGGRQMPGHFGKKSTRIVTGSSPVTTQVPHAVGFGLAAKMKKKEFVAFTTFGEGSSNQGDFHEGINFASVHDLPVIFMCENNKYAISVPLDKQLNIESVAERAKGYGIHGESVDGNDPLAVYEAVMNARKRAIAGEGPSLIETVSYRLTPHSSDDDDSTYRAKEEVEEAKKIDPVHTFCQYLKDAHVLTEEKDEEIRAKLRREIDEATDYAENASYPNVETLMDYVYGEE
ncbi:thiamine pyrophosphate-dependent dehydrogenase E1 component subunit alpha [Salipaludibacillus agaradhaerens]|uniref:2-oxoisovalerate dehydrogenase subunit alpha n=1 Tax=Salipaludibacillus agaradhaerens TaxID=76935 RepID=A0A9Q4FZ00_SALAG|nr:thiamine pyrophosphate-dependent dehydrogenase E1 component subunit alpha [Salipaludibacillus agaradhaerens]MCR6096647.1 thiamine pyrophosphate-dependent dehydrogenase E1 component subunit alpha [Salipaludibacillus agaradhaerens]MCR6106447.1 thiamine pyrophosphate-dependent dehydrogenase E1 component subunit alpha [Salipaludibacillus agaradhaerens]MCR6113794.1 thiamine pyrophosphate-dependent dehydrogenase E1 component subunit alpha [Salipaludibacillus agaradhaerens]MCR6118480.1 thiamine pyr